MGDLLLGLTYNTLDALAPDMRDVGKTFVTRFANWVTEKDSRRDSASHIHDIDSARYVSMFGAPEFAKRLRYKSSAYDDGLHEARAWGLVASMYEKDWRTGAWNLHPTNTLVDVLGAYVALEAHRRAAVEHLTGRPLNPVHVEGIGPKADWRTRTYPKLDETLTPMNAEAAVAALIRQVQVAHIGRVGTDEYAHWTPNGRTTAALLVGAVHTYTGAPMPAVHVPAITYRGSHPVLTPDLIPLLPQDVIDHGVPPTGVSVRKAEYVQSVLDGAPVAGDTAPPALTPVPTSGRRTGRSSGKPPTRMTASQFLAVAGGAA
ncbi:MAG: hypothetical protein NVV66_16330 [Cellulomonas sp.]|uniref:hypothetical protein n=1 Tax=Cellulomonas sp. TaxID=40001 RepID=UPI002585FFB5|nr:hypothetical protein [Cellulomonas sp.]MCR6706184.1 hypothetical protein [Cellulomonas sp.]